MFWIDASGIVAPMTDEHPFGNWPDVRSVKQPMTWGHSAIEPDRSVTEFACGDSVQFPTSSVRDCAEVIGNVGDYTIQGKTLRPIVTHVIAPLNKLTVTTNIPQFVKIV
jgi:hypothetical protein